jgi:hypothetical protein
MTPMSPEPLREPSLEPSVEPSKAPPADAVNGTGSGDGKPEDPLTPEDLMEAWNDICVPLGLGKVKELSVSRKKKALLRLHEHPNVDFWNLVFAHIKVCAFLKGLVPAKKEGQRPFRASFDWLLEDDTNAIKVAEGKYL